MYEFFSVLTKKNLKLSNLTSFNNKFQIMSLYRFTMEEYEAILTRLPENEIEMFSNIELSKVFCYLNFFRRRFSSGDIYKIVTLLTRYYRIRICSNKLLCCYDINNNPESLNVVVARLFNEL